MSLVSRSCNFRFAVPGSDPFDNSTFPRLSSICALHLAFSPTGTRQVNSRSHRSAWDAISRFVFTTPPQSCIRSVLLQTEHIDNPKGYGEGEDPRKYDKRLRGVSTATFLGSVFTDPCIFSLWTYVAPRHIAPANPKCFSQPRELEIDPRTGMKNYIANGQIYERIDVPSLTNMIVEDGGWDTSRALVRRTLEECIRRGRAQRANGQKADEYESYRLLGQAVGVQRYSPLVHLLMFSFCSYIPWKILPPTQISVNLRSGRWVIPRSSCTSETR